MHKAECAQARRAIASCTRVCAAAGVLLGIPLLYILPVHMQTGLVRAPDTGHALFRKEAIRLWQEEWDLLPSGRVTHSFLQTSLVIPFLKRYLKF